MSVMTTAAPPNIGRKLLTAAEFFRLPDPPNGARQELVRGEVVEIAAPGFRHGKRAFRVAKVLDNYVSARRCGHITVESGVLTERGPDTVRIPDVAYWSAERIPLDQEPDGYPDVAPEIAIEILSPSNRPGQMRLKVNEYFAAGVQMVWLIDPIDRMCWVYTVSQEGASVFGEKETVTGGDVLLDFSCKVSEFFAD